MPKSLLNLFPCASNRNRSFHQKTLSPLNDMHIQALHFHWSRFFCWSIKLHSVLKRMRNQFSDFCVFECLRYGRSKFFDFSEKKQFVPKDAQCPETDFSVCGFFLDTFNFWDIADFVSTFVVNWGLRHFYEPDSKKLTSDTRLPICVGDSIQKHSACGGQSPI